MPPADADMRSHVHARGPWESDIYKRRGRAEAAVPQASPDPGRGIGDSTVRRAQKYALDRRGAAAGQSALSTDETWRGAPWRLPARFGRARRQLRVLLQQQAGRA